MTDSGSQQTADATPLGVANSSVRTIPAPERRPAQIMGGSGTGTWPAVGEMIGDFELLKLLGEGGMGRVFLARQISLERNVALKVTPNCGMEARNLAQLEHAHIVPVYSETVVPDRDLRLLCMQLVSGTSLAEIISHLKHRAPERWSGSEIIRIIDQLTTQAPVFDPTALRDRELLENADYIQAVCWIGARVAEALDYAQEREVLHRDVKPANILMTPFGRPMLVDFSVAFRLRAAPSAKGQVLGGTLAYMSPEHLEAFAAPSADVHAMVDIRSDIYSLGVVLFECLTGELPFDRDTEDRSFADLSDLAAYRRTLIPVPSSRRPVGSNPIDYVVSECLQPDPAARFQSAAALADALDSCREFRRIERELPPGGVFTTLARRRPFQILVFLTLLPHVLGSLVNISYNALQIVEGLTQAQQVIFKSVVVTYNVVVYPLCVFALLRLIAPVWRKWREISGTKRVSRLDLAALRRRTLTWPGWAVWIACLGWLPGGLLFPLVIHFASDPLSAADFGHFLVSFTLSGLIALTYSFFGIQFVVLCVFYPRLWADTRDLYDAIWSELGGVGGRIRFFQLLAGVIPLSGAVLTVAVSTYLAQDWLYRLLLVSLILLGMAGFGGALWVTEYLQKCLDVFQHTPRRSHGFSRLSDGSASVSEQH